MDLEKKNVFYNEILNLINGLKDEVKELKEESKKRKREDDDVSISDNVKKFEPSTSELTNISQDTVVATPEERPLTPILRGEILEAREFVSKEDGGYETKIRKVLFHCNVNDMIKYKLNNKRFTLRINRQKGTGDPFVKFELSFFKDNFSIIE